MSKYIVLNQLIDREIINQIMKMDDSAEIVVDSTSSSHDHRHMANFVGISNFFNEFDLDNYTIYDVIKYQHIEDLILGTILSEYQYVILDISDNELDEFHSMCDYNRIETFEDLIHTLDCIKGQAEEATDYDIDGSLETVIDAIDNNLDDIRHQFDNMRSEMINDIKISWSSHIHNLSA